MPRVNLIPGIGYSVESDSFVNLIPGIGYSGPTTARGVHLPPVSDVSVGAWVPVPEVPLYQTLADASDSTYASTVAPSAFIVGVKPVTDPQSDDGHILHFRGYSSVSANYKMSLYNGAVLIAEWTEALSAGVAEYSYTFTTAEAASIPSAAYYGTLRIRGEAL